MVSGLHLHTACWLAATFGRQKSMQRNARRGEVKLSPHGKRSPQQYLQLSRMYFDAHRDHSLLCVNVASETTQRTRWTPKAFEWHYQARSARFTCWSSTDGSAATKCNTKPTGAQAGLKSFNGRRMKRKCAWRGSAGGPGLGVHLYNIVGP